MGKGKVILSDGALVSRTLIGTTLTEVYKVTGKCGKFIAAAASPDAESKITKWELDTVAKPFTEEKAAMIFTAAENGTHTIVVDFLRDCKQPIEILEYDI